MVRHSNLRLFIGDGNHLSLDGSSACLLSISEKNLRINIYLFIFYSYNVTFTLTCLCDNVAQDGQHAKSSGGADSHVQLYFPYLYILLQQDGH